MAYIKVSCTDAFIGTAPVIKITPLVVNAQTPSIFTVTWEFGSQSGTIATRTRQTTFTDYVWTTYFYNEIPDRMSGTGVILVDCYRGDGTFVETVTTEFTAKVNPSNSTPTISLPSIIDVNDDTTALTGDNKKFIRYMSTAAVSVNVSTRNGADLAEIYIENGGQGVHGTGSSGFRFYNIQSPRFVVQAKDTRGLITSITYEIPAEDFIQYIKLTCNMGNERPDTSGNMTLTCDGNCYYGSFSAGTGNSITLEYRYKEQGGSFGSWRYMSYTTPSDSTYRATAAITGLDYQKTYVFECRASDELMTVTSAGDPVQSTPVFHWSADDFVFEVPVIFAKGATGVEGGTDGAGGDQLIAGDLRLKGSGNYGNTLYFGDGSYCYLREETDDDLTIKASDLNLNVSSLYLNGAPIKAGTWTPTLTSSSAVSSYSTRSGWYVRVGNVVTVGFNIGASCNSGYNSTALAISGLPFTPASNAFGGGVMFGAYVNAGFCFEAWAATTGGQITPRLQPCNNTTAGNLQIASTAYYPSGANSLTLGGTITYITN